MIAKHLNIIFRFFVILVVFALCFYLVLVLGVEIFRHDDILNPELSVVIAPVKDINDQEISFLVNKNPDTYAVGLNKNGEIIFRDTNKAFEQFKRDYEPFLVKYGYKNGIFYYSQKNWSDLLKIGYRATGSAVDVKDRKIYREINIFLRYFKNSFK